VKPGIIYLLIHIYHQLLRLYPADFRDEFGLEMEEVFAAAVEEAGEMGMLAVGSVCAKEIVTYPSSLLAAYAKSWRNLQPEPVVAAPSLRWVSGWALLIFASFPLAWILSAPLGAALILLLSLVFGKTFEVPSFINASEVRAFGFFLALVMTLTTCQWLLLRSHLPHAGWWIPVTVLGWLAAVIIVPITGYWLLRKDIIQTAPLFLFILAGATIGLSQWLFLRHIIPRAGWWILISLLAFTPILLVGGSFSGLLTLFIFLLLPGIISGMGLWLLLQQGTQSSTAVTQPRRRPARRPLSRRLLRLGIAFIFLVPLFTIAPLAYTKSQLELAKRDGIYATVEEAVIDRLGQGWGGAEVVRLEGSYAVPNWPDGRLPHVWFGGARVWLDRVPDGYNRDNYSAGSFYIRVEEGWVHVPEGAFPGFVGRMMEIYGLEGAGRNGPGK
jgi:hypothetical protein